MTEAAMLMLAANIESPDEFYAALIDSHRGLTAEASALLNAKLILLLANQVGSLAVLRAALAKAREGIAATEDDGTLAAVAS